MSDKKILLELVKREVFVRVFNCLTIHATRKKYGWYYYKFRPFGNVINSLSNKFPIYL